MNITNQDRRAHICKLFYANYNDCMITDIPGENFIDVKGLWIEMPIQSAELKEVEVMAGEMIEQEITAVVKGKNAEMDAEITKIIGLPLILMLQYSNDENRIVGTRDNPIILSEDSSGVITSRLLTSKHISAEKAKKLTSFR